MPDEAAWCNSFWWHCIVFTSALVVATMMTYGELSDPHGYALRAVFSPTKLYHNFGLYWLLGYIGASTLIALIGHLVANFNAGDLMSVTRCLVPGVFWVVLLIAEHNDDFLKAATGLPGQEVKQTRVQTAHVADWQPIWASGWRIRFT